MAEIPLPAAGKWTGVSLLALLPAGEAQSLQGAGFIPQPGKGQCPSQCRASGSPHVSCHLSIGQRDTCHTCHATEGPCGRPWEKVSLQSMSHCCYHRGVALRKGT